MDFVRPSLHHRRAINLARCLESLPSFHNGRRWSTEAVTSEDNRSRTHRCWNNAFNSLELFVRRAEVRDRPFQDDPLRLKRFGSRRLSSELLNFGHLCLELVDLSRSCTKLLDLDNLLLKIPSFISQSVSLSPKVP
ncbi:hypothetical protein GUJ93_ZPchr0013g34466 [Zizania palustris]|uniref:Uncharacterized protein n=1 Tax=Zizania palustris TaxID=103762 RepID=A0A8J5WSB7_ZIZPA|nr:hypothetical protein GUJ93_ZPchr0013g34466 [Zizania palustris]